MGSLSCLAKNWHRNEINKTTLRHCEVSGNPARFGRCIGIGTWCNFGTCQELQLPQSGLFHGFSPSKSEARSAVDGKFGPYVAKCSVCVFCKVWKSTAQRCGSFFAFVGHLAYIPCQPVIDHWRRTECIMATVRPLSGGFCPALIFFGWGLFQSQAPDEVIEDIIKALKVQHLERSTNFQ